MWNYPGGGENDPWRIHYKMDYKKVDEKRRTASKKRHSINNKNIPRANLIDGFGLFKLTTYITVSMI